MPGAAAACILYVAAMLDSNHLDVAGGVQAKRFALSRQARWQWRDLVLDYPHVLGR